MLALRERGKDKGDSQNSTVMLSFPLGSEGDLGLLLLSRPTGRGAGSVNYIDPAPSVAEPDLYSLVARLQEVESDSIFVRDPARLGASRIQSIWTCEGGAGSSCVPEEPAPFVSAADAIVPSDLVGNRLIDRPTLMVLVRLHGRSRIHCVPEIGPINRGPTPMIFRSSSYVRGAGSQLFFLAP